MNKLILVAVAATAASGIAAAPAFAGLSHNPSFSHQLPVHVPSGAQTVKVADEHRSREHPATSISPSAKATRSPEAEPSDDRKGGQARDNGRNDLVDNDVNDDNGAGEALEPGDDSGHDGQATAQPSSAPTTEAEPGDDKGGAATAPVTVPTVPTVSTSSHSADTGDDKGGSGSGRASSGSSGHDG